jgi:hypothetical protein
VHILASVFMTFAAVGFGFAQDPSSACALFGPAYRFASDIVEWNMTIASGGSCVRGLRGALATLDEIKILSPPEFGQVTVAGPGFIYKPSSDFRGADSFAFLVSGKINRVSGSSTVRILVTVR